MLEFFTTAPYINSEMCVLRRVFDGHCSQNTLFSTNFRNGRAKKTEKHEPEPCFVQKAHVFSVAEPCGTGGDRGRQTTDSLHIYVRTPHRQAMFGEKLPKAALLGHPKLAKNPLCLGALDP